MKQPSCALWLLQTQREVHVNVSIRLHLFKCLKSPVAAFISDLIPPPQSHQEPACHILGLHQANLHLLILTRDPLLCIETAVCS